MFKTKDNTLMKSTKSEKYLKPLCPCARLHVYRMYMFEKLLSVWSSSAIGLFCIHLLLFETI